MMRRATAMVAAVVAVAAGAATAATIPAMARTVVRDTSATTVSSGTAAIPSGLLAMATSWPTAQRGIVLAYPSRTTGAKPYLLGTGNGGKSWASLTAPPLPYPEDNDQPDAVWSDGVVAVTDGTHVDVTTGNGKHWKADKLSGVSGSFFVSNLAVAGGRVLVLVHTSQATSLYSGIASSGALTRVRGLSFNGPGIYGDISTAGAVQVDLGNGVTSQKYWYSRNGKSFTSAPLPCGVTQQALLGGVRSGNVIALCTDGESAIAPGETKAQLGIAGRLGGTFHPSGSATVLANVQDFAAASVDAATAATEGGMIVTANAGETWKSELTEPNGAFCSDLAFPGPTTGFVVCTTVNNAGKEIGTVYRTTNSGKSWNSLSL